MVVGALMPALSILIPARNEQFLSRTIQDILEHSEADTEVIVVLDGPSPHEPPPDDPRVRVVELAEPIGQRAATNLACRMSEAKYVMKCDAHCSFGQGFDRIMLEDMQDDWTMVPTMYNLHAFDWVCERCKARYYQGPTPEKCAKCGGAIRRDVLWRAKPNPETTSMRFDRELKFQYWAEYKSHQKGDLVETMSLLGACWLLTRERYWALEICDEKHGSWGQQGTEVACKTWLSGGRLICTKRTWFAHMFRTQGGDFGFPYPLSGNDVAKARHYSKELWLEGKWHGAIRPLSWIINHFAPVPDWEDDSAQATSAQVIYYTDNRLDPTLMQAAQTQLLKACGSCEVISVSLKPLDFGRNIVIDAERGPLTMFGQILAGLEASTAEVIFFAEHDVLYHPSHFQFSPKRKDVFYYDGNFWQVDAKSGHALTRVWRATSGLCAYRSLLLEHYRKRVKMVEANGYSVKMGYEPGSHNRPERVDDYGCEIWMAEFPSLDIRHDKNLTPTRWKKEQFRNAKYTEGWQESDSVPGWGRTEGHMAEILNAIINHCG